MKYALFIDRDGTLIVEPPITFQVDNLSQLSFLPGVIQHLHFIQEKLPQFELVMVTNQDGLGTPVYPQENFDAVQGKMLEVFQGEGVSFNDILIDKSFPKDNLPTRKPNTGMLTAYMDGSYDLSRSYVIGDRVTDVMLAHNLGARAILIAPSVEEGENSLKCADFDTEDVKVVVSWKEIAEFLFAGERVASIHRKTKETDIHVELNLDGTGRCDISTGLCFFDHMLEQIGKHSGCDLTVHTKGDLKVDEHHTIEDTAIVLGEALYKALGDKRGIERYGFFLPMDDSHSVVALDFGGRPWLVWRVKFKREYVGDVPTEMFLHFFKSLSDAAKMNLYVRAEGDNEHHKIEGIFKAFARSIRAAIRRDVNSFVLPSTKGAL